MATDYGPEIKKAIGEHTGQPPRPKTSPPKQGNDPGDTPADMARDRRLGIKEDSPQDQRIDARNAPNTMPPRMAEHMQGGGPPPDAHHVAAAASIAHAILGNRPASGGGY